MIAQRFKPPAEISNFIREYVIFHAIFNPAATIPPKSYPVIPEEGIIFIVKGHLVAESPETGDIQLRPTSFVFGPPKTRQNLHISHEYLMLCVRFQPGALHRLSGIHMTEFVHNYVEAECVFGTEIKSIYEQLVNSLCYTQMMLIVSSYFKNKIAKIAFDEHPIHTIGEMILNNPYQFNLDTIAGEACLSNRQFERRFLQQIGVTPKLFSRICRFQKAWELKEIQPDLDWLSIAIYNGYSDYQHLVKDFKQFAGTTPPSFMDQCNDNPERVLNLASTFKGA